MQWAAGIDRSALPWRIVAYVIAGAFVIAVLGWVVLRYKEWRVGQRGSLVEWARPYGPPLLVILALGLALWVVQTVF